MNRSLGRLLRIRELMEDRARADLEARNAELRALEESAELQRRMVRRIQDDAVEDLARQEPAAEEWRLKAGDAAVSGSREARLGVLAEKARPVVDQARDAWTARRRELRQVEILQATAAREEGKRQLRREQNRTDDWFQSRPGNGKGRR